jgi:hypothetical protein
MNLYTNPQPIVDRRGFLGAALHGSPGRGAGAEPRRQAPSLPPARALQVGPICIEPTSFSIAPWALAGLPLMSQCPPPARGRSEVRDASLRLGQGAGAQVVNMAASTASASTPMWVMSTLCGLARSVMGMVMVSTPSW